MVVAAHIIEPSPALGGLLFFGFVVACVVAWRRGRRCGYCGRCRSCGRHR